MSTPRAPDVPPRRARAQATQWRIVKAAFGLFCERGYVGTTMAQIAEAAGVAVQTVYFTFNTKAAVLSRAYDFAVMGEGEPQVPWDQPWYREMVAAADVVEALRHLVSGVGDITRRLTPLYVVASGSAAGDPEVAAVVDRHERWRVEGYRDMLEVLRAKAPLRADLTPRSGPTTCCCSTPGWTSTTPSWRSRAGHMTSGSRGPDRPSPISCSGSMVPPAVDGRMA